jgi:hypothetical protein
VLFRSAAFRGPVTYVDGRGTPRTASELTADPSAFVLSAAAARREEAARCGADGSVHVDVHDTYVAVSRIDGSSDADAEAPVSRTTVLPVGLDTRVVHDGRGGYRLSSDCVLPLASTLRHGLPIDGVLAQTRELAQPGTGASLPSFFIAGTASRGLRSLTTPECRMLEMLASGPVSHSELARTLRVRGPVLASLTNRLRKAGLIDCIAVTLGDLIERIAVLPNCEARRALTYTSAQLAGLVAAEIARWEEPFGTVVVTGVRDGGACLSEALERTTSLRVDAPDSSAFFGARGVLRIRGHL